MDLLATGGLLLFAILIIAFLILHPKQTLLWCLIICVIILLIKYLPWIALIIGSLIAWGYLVYLLKTSIKKFRKSTKTGR